MAAIATRVHLDGGMVRLIVGVCEVDLSPADTRRLARVLYRTAREAEKRQAEADHD